MARKPVSPKTKRRGLTEKGKRVGRRPNYLTDEQLANPSGDTSPAEPHHALSTLDIIQGVLAGTRPKFGAILAGKDDVRAVQRENRRLQRIRKLMRDIQGIDKMR